MILLDVINKLLALGVIASQIFIVLAVVYFFVPCKTKLKVYSFFSRNSIKFAFIIACLAMAGSLFYSNYAGFVPCPLCWFQRIFMYPEVILLGLALIKKDENVIDYNLALSVIGLAISIYHNYIYIQGLYSVVCTTAESCIAPYVTEFGYITIPMMALTAFALISLLLINKKIYGKKI